LERSQDLLTDHSSNERERSARRGRANLELEDALQLVHLYGERGSPKYEWAAMRWLQRYVTESNPRLRHFAEIVASLAKHEA
jgi:hypothetical protein